DLIRLLSANPARIFGLWPRKGDLAPGFDADILIFDPRPQRVLSAAELHSRAGFSPYEGLTVTGRLSTTIVRGQVVYQNGKVVGKPDFGRFQPSEPFDPAAALLLATSMASACSLICRPCRRSAASQMAASTGWP